MRRSVLFIAAAALLAGFLLGRLTAPTVGRYSLRTSGTVLIFDTATGIITIRTKATETQPSEWRTFDPFD